MRAAQRDHKTGVQQPTGDLWEENVLTWGLFSVTLSGRRKNNLCSQDVFIHIYCVFEKK